MSEKIVVGIYFTYGKGDGDELYERFVTDNTPEGRKSIFEYISYDDSFDSKDDFISGKIDFFSFENYGGDWDEPTGGYIVVNTKDELIKNIKKKAEEEILEIENLFNETQ